MSRTGRRPGTPDTRAAIVEAARQAFATKGYQAATFRAIAEDAGVDPGLITHYFGTKDGLFAAALELPVKPSDLLTDLRALAPPDAVNLVVGSYLSLLDDPATRNPLLALIRSAVSQESAARMVREFLTEEILAPIAATTDLPDAQLRASLVAAQLVGIAMVRYVVGIQALAAADISELVPLVAAVVEQYLTRPS